MRARSVAVDVIQFMVWSSVAARTISEDFAAHLEFVSMSADTDGFGLTGPCSGAHGNLSPRKGLPVRAELMSLVRTLGTGVTSNRSVW